MNRAEKADKRLGRAALERMRAYHWPGNVRELKNVMDRAFILADQVITTECLPALSGDATPTSAEPVGLGPAIELKPGISIGEAEKRLIFATLEACNGNKERAARVLEISLKTLYNRLNAYNGRGKQRPPSSAADAPRSHVKKRILIVDDDPDIAEPLGLLLASHYRVDTAGNGARGDRMHQRCTLRRRSARPDDAGDGRAAPSRPTSTGSASRFRCC